ncbi:LuxR C-terminal-related transcriptional regulator [Pseudomonas schmalbachii]|uniref:Helix-turn-helix transcriptional regulator n=1 Tax=Pseudomonas schmalbachii TaxID=2816993 RepID=A0ABS3TPS9_9PSED|nr:LuxR C-terminal-related transcriptional regulator [Pseudomonas schmalbachii]MBO3275658.1 helix-turn-helix transcriptional regulator [Pseudomonas schmalbachii]
MPEHKNQFSSANAPVRDEVGTAQAPAGPSGKSVQPASMVRLKLVDQMENAGSAKLMLIRAAAGFGKSTLLRQYRERCRATGRQTAWLSLEPTDNDLSRFISRLDACVGELDPEGLIEGGVLDTISDVEPVYTLLESIAGQARPFSILLDEFEVIQSPAVLNFIQQLLAALPPHGCLVIASRTAPEIGLGRIRARGQLLEVDPGALRFSLEETGTFLRETHRLQLDSGDIAALHRCTEGWIAALYLAALSLKGRDDPSAFIQSFSGSNLNLAAYLAEQILAQQSEECRRFLLQTSVLNRFCAPLCDALTGRNDSQAMIESLLRANLFLFPADEEQRWFRYHSLFAGFLQDVLERQTPGAARELHRAAAHWYLSVKQPIPAIDHLISAGDTDEAIAQLTEHLDDLVRGGLVRLLVRWLAQLPPAALGHSPRLQLASAWALVLCRRYQSAQEFIASYRPSPEIESARVILLACTDRMEEAYEFGQSLLRRLPTDDHFVYGLTANTMAYVMQATGHYEEARRLLSEAIPYVSQQGAGFMRNVAASVESILDLAQGRLGNALARLQAFTQQQADTAADNQFGAQISLDMIRSVTLYEVDDLEGAQRVLNEGLSYSIDSGVADALISSHVLLSRIAALRGDTVAGQRYLNDLETIGRDGGSSRIQCSAWMERTRVATLEGRLDAAQQALRQVEKYSDWDRPDVFMYSNDVDTPAITRLRLRVAQGQCAQSLDGLREAIAEAQGHSLMRRALKLRLLHALALDGAGRQTEAFDVLTEALQFASHEGFLRTFLDEGKRLAELLQRWAVTFQARSRSLGIAPGFLADLLKRLEPARQDSASDGGRDALTKRELQIIRLLADGCPIPEIATKLFLSENTVKTHIRNVSVKLGTHSRNESLAIARARGLLD